MAKYPQLCKDMDLRGGYMSNAIGMCQRELLVVHRKKKSQANLFLTASATYGAFLRRENLGERFNSSRAEPAALIWTHDLKTNQKCPPFPVAVDWTSGVIRQENTLVFGLLEDVRHCLVHRAPDGHWETCNGPTGANLDETPAAGGDDFDLFTTVKPKPNGRGLARIGQAWYREKLMEIWEGRCSVTDCDQPELLRASHIVAWSKAAGKERLDPENGLLLAAHLDAAFDKGLISFAADGAILISPRFKPRTLTLLGIHPGLRLRRMSPAVAGYLAKHREHYGYSPLRQFAQNNHQHSV